MSNSNGSSDGIGVLGLLGIVFVTLKLTSVIDWSWWYVTMPFWGCIALVAACGLLWLIGYSIILLIKVSKQKSAIKNRYSRK